MAALERHPLFLSAALPARIYPPMFNRYDSTTSMAFGSHVDGAVRLLPGTGTQIRTDISATHLMVTGALLGGALAMAYAPWMASYSENAEDIDPRLQGTAWGLYSFLSKSSSVLVLLFVPILVTVIGWQGWLWISVAGLVLYLPAVFMFKGPWRRSQVPVPQQPATAPVGD